MTTPTIIWNIDADGDWATSADWSPSRLPNDADDVSINTADRHTVTHSTGTDFVGTLTVGNDDFTVSGGSLTVNFTSSFAHKLAVSGGTLKLGGAAAAASLAQSDSTVGGAGTLTVAGAATFASKVLEAGSGATKLAGASTLAAGATLYLDGGRLVENQLTFTASGGIEMGANPFGAALGGATIQNDAGATFDIQAPISINADAGTVAIHNAGTLEQTGTVGVSKIYAPITNTGAIWVKSGTLELAGGLTNLAGSALNGGTYEADAGATLELAANATIVSDNAAIVLSGAGSKIQALNELGQEVGIESTLTAVGAAGTLELLKGRAWTSAQALTDAGTIVLGNNTLMTAALTMTATGTVNLEGGTLNLTGSSVLAGAIIGKGALDFAGGSAKVNNGASLGPATVSLSGGAAVEIAGNLTSSGAFSQAAGTTLTVDAGDKLYLTGPATLAGTVNGAGTVKVSAATVGAVTIGGSATLSDVGVVDQTGELMIGAAGATGATLAIGAGATWRIDNNHGAKNPGPPGKSSIRNSGLFIKSGGTGTSIIAVTMADGGAIEAASGALDFTKSLTGAGTLAVDGGATLEVGASAASTLSLTFNGANGTLALGHAARFAATINGFSATDAIDLVKTAADAATLGPGDTLRITDGAASVATLQLAGDYTGATFNVTPDGAGGSIIVVTPSGASMSGASIGANSHRLIAAMAGLGAAGGPVDRVAAEYWRPPPPSLSAPRMHLA
jgi:hypothetical protein